MGTLGFPALLRRAGREPRTLCLQDIKKGAKLLSLTPFLWEHLDSNQGPSACKADALNQLSYAPLIFLDALNPPRRKLCSHFISRCSKSAVAEACSQKRECKDIILCPIYKFCPQILYIFFICCV